MRITLDETLDGVLSLTLHFSSSIKSTFRLFRGRKKNWGNWSAISQPAAAHELFFFFFFMWVFFISMIKACIMEAEVIRLLSSGCGAGQQGPGLGPAVLLFATGRSGRKLRHWQATNNWLITLFVFYIYIYQRLTMDRSMREHICASRCFVSARVETKWHSSCLWREAWFEKSTENPSALENPWDTSLL